MNIKNQEWFQNTPKTERKDKKYSKISSSLGDGKGEKRLINRAHLTENII